MTLAESQTIRNLVRLHGAREVMTEVAFELEAQAQGALGVGHKILAEKTRANATGILLAAKDLA